MNNIVQIIQLQSNNVSRSASRLYLGPIKKRDGTNFNYAITGITAADISSGSLTGTVTISSGTGSTSITLVGFDGTESETATCTFSTPGGDRVTSVSVVDLVETVSLEGSIASPSNAMRPKKEVVST